MLTTLSNWTSFHLKILHKLCKSSKKGLIFLNCVRSQTFYPNLLIFLHGYIRHIRDILQLWQQFTFTKILTQAKKYHHFLLPMSRALVDSMGHQWSTQSNSSNIRNKCNKQTNKAKCKRSSKKTSLVAQRTQGIGPKDP